MGSKKNKQDTMYNSNTNNIHEIISVSDNKSENKKIVNDFVDEILDKTSNDKQGGILPRDYNSNSVNQFEDNLSKKMMSLDMNNDDIDDIFDIFKDGNIMKK